MPVGKPDSLPTESATEPEKPESAVIETVNIAKPPGRTACKGWITAMSKSGDEGSTFTSRVGGLGSEPLAPISVSETTYSPGEENVTSPGIWAVEVGGEPPGKTHE